MTVEKPNSYKPMSKIPYLLQPGDKVQILQTGQFAIIREIYDNGSLLADLINESPDDFPIYDYQDQFVIAT